MKYAYVRQDTGEIEGFLETADPAAMTQANPPYLVTPYNPEIPEEEAMRLRYFHWTGTVDTSYFAIRDPRPADYYYSWINYEWVLDSDKLYERLRERRDYELRLCDWTQLADAPLTEQEKTNWQVYRQALRDLPQTFPNLTHLDDVVWPVAPQ